MTRLIVPETFEKQFPDRWVSNGVARGCWECMEFNRESIAELVSTSAAGVDLEQFAHDQGLITCMNNHQIVESEDDIAWQSYRNNDKGDDENPNPAVVEFLRSAMGEEFVLPLLCTEWEQMPPADRNQMTALIMNSQFRSSWRVADQARRLVLAYRGGLTKLISDRIPFCPQQGVVDSPSRAIRSGTMTKRGLKKKKRGVRHIS